MILTSLLRILKSALQSISRNIWLSIVTVIIIVLTLFSINLSYFLIMVTDQTLKAVREKVDILVSFKPEVTPEQVYAVEAYLKSLKEVKEIQYISRQEALETLKRKHKDKEQLQEALRELEENPLGDTLVIKAFELKDYPSILEILDEPQYKDLIEEREFKDYRIFLDKLSFLLAKIKKAGMFLSSIFIVIATLVVLNTIRLAIYTHEKEIGIMKLVGASNWFIRSPFLVEAIIYALVASALVAILVYPFLYLIQPYLSSFFGEFGIDLMAYYQAHFFKIFGYEFLGMAGLSVVTSYGAIRRYLKV